MSAAAALNMSAHEAALAAQLSRFRSHSGPLSPHGPGGGGGQVDKREHIKKPLNAFMLFMKENRSQVIKECTLKESAAINQILGRKWHSLKKEDQAKYYEMARKEKEMHLKMYPGWTARDNYAIHSKRKKRRREIRGERDCANAKKCRARFGIAQHELWCQHCKRKKRCLRFQDEDEAGGSGGLGGDAHDDGEDDDDDDDDDAEDMLTPPPSAEAPLHIAPPHHDERSGERIAASPPQQFIGGGEGDSYSAVAARLQGIVGGSGGGRTSSTAAPHVHLMSPPDIIKHEPIDPDTIINPASDDSDYEYDDDFGMPVDETEQRFAGEELEHRRHRRRRRKDGRGSQRNSGGSGPGEQSAAAVPIASPQSSTGSGVSSAASVGSSSSGSNRIVSRGGDNSGGSAGGAINTSDIEADIDLLSPADSCATPPPSSLPLYQPSSAAPLSSSVCMPPTVIKRGPPSNFSVESFLHSPTSSDSGCCLSAPPSNSSAGSGPNSNSSTTSSSSDRDNTILYRPHEFGSSYCSPGAAPASKMKLSPHPTGDLLISTGLSSRQTSSTAVLNPGCEGAVGSSSSAKTNSDKSTPRPTLCVV